MSEQTIYTVVIVVLVIGLLLLKDLFFPRRSKKKDTSKSQKIYAERLKNPKFEELEKHFGKPFPQGVKALYGNTEEINRDCIDVVAKSPNGEEKTWFIAFYQPADLEQVTEQFQNTRQVFEFANDGSGNGYTIDPRLEDPPVMFYDHETGEWEKVADSFSKFMAMPRRAVEG